MVKNLGSCAGHSPEVCLQFCMFTMDGAVIPAVPLSAPIAAFHSNLRKANRLCIEGMVYNVTPGPQPTLPKHLTETEEISESCLSPFAFQQSCRQ